MLLNIVNEYKVKKAEESVDWQSCQSKYANILPAFQKEYLSKENAEKIRTVNGVRKFSMLITKRGCDAIVFKKLRFHLFTHIRESGVFKNFHFGRHFQKVAFSVTENAGHMWVEGETNRKCCVFKDVRIRVDGVLESPGCASMVDAGGENFVFWNVLVLKS